MIHSTSHSDNTERARAVPTKPKASDAISAGRDQFSQPKAEQLREALSKQPEVRPEVVARARALLADPAYPSKEILGKVAEIILRAPDLSEE